MAVARFWSNVFKRDQTRIGGGIANRRLWDTCLCSYVRKNPSKVRIPPLGNQPSNGAVPP